MAVKLLKLLLGLVLAPLVAGEIWTIIDLARAAIPAAGWREGWFISFGAGIATWCLIFVLLPRTMWLYVLGHEFTHALASMLVGGKVSSFQVSAKGGHVITDRVNWWITLAPYFIPLYAIVWMALWVVVDFYHPLRAYQPMLFFGLGLFWAFHLTFTGSMMHRGQTDLSSQGFIFSLVVILLFNLVFFLLLFGVLTHELSMAGVGKLFLDRTADAYAFTWRELVAGAAWAVNTTRHLK